MTYYDLLVRSINGFGILAAVIVVIAYLIARPHIGTVWYVNADNARPTPVPSGMIDWSKYGGHPPPSPSPPPIGFPTRQDCWNAEGTYGQLVGVIGLECMPRYALLWGW